MITFEFQVEDLGSITYRLHPPFVPEDRQAWMCWVEWSGLEDYRCRIGGASSLQCLELALAFIRSELTAAFPDKRITQDGVPFI